MEIDVNEVKMLIGELNLTVYTLSKKIAVLEAENKKLTEENQRLESIVPKAGLRRMDG